MNLSEVATLEYDGAVAVVTLNQPETGNALSREMCEALDRLATDLAGKESVRSILLCANGKNFCVGGDLKHMERGQDLGSSLQELVAPLHQAIAKLSQLSAPLVVAARGAAAGAGLSLVALSDYAVAADNAKFVMAYSAIGLTPDGGATWSLPRLIGSRRAKELALTNRRLGAEEALDWGIVNEVCEDAELNQRGLAIARRFADGPSLAFARTLELMDASERTSLQAQLDIEQSAIIEAGATQDATEGVTSMIARRQPSFAGR